MIMRKDQRGCVMCQRLLDNLPGAIRTVNCAFKQVCGIDNSDLELR